MPQILRTPLQSSVPLFKALLLLLLLLNPLINAAQVSNVELKQLEKESSFKIITVAVSGISDQEAALRLENRIETLKGVTDCFIDHQNNKCTIIAGFNVQKNDVLGVTGSANVKTSDYSEEIRWQTEENFLGNTRYSSETERTLEVYGDPAEKEKVESEKKKALAQMKAEDDRKHDVTGYTPNTLPEDFPKYVETGNKAEDDLNYANAKEEWIQKNPNKYRELFEHASDEVKEIPYAEFLKMSPDKQKLVEGMPDKYKIVK